MSTFGGNFFGKPVPLSRPIGSGNGPLPVVKPGQAAPASPQGVQGGKLGVVPPPPSAPTAMGPQGPVPMGKKGECPICRG